MIRIALLLSLASLTGLHTPAILVGDKLDKQDDREVITKVLEVKDQEVLPNRTVEKELLQAPYEPKEAEEEVRSYFKDIPLLVRVAQCESNFRHTGKDGEILRGVANRYDVGIMQINERFHLDKANRLGLDIYTLDGNLEYAKYLYEKEGVSPWKASSKCWTGTG